MIEENGIRGAGTIDEWTNQIDLVIKLLSMDFIAQGWIESNNFIENLRCIFNANLTKISDIYEHCLQRYPVSSSTNTKNFKKILREIKDDHLAKYINKNNAIEKIHSDKIMEILILFLSDKSKHYVKNLKKEFTLKTCLGEFVNNGHEFYQMNNLFDVFNNTQKDYSAFHKNFVFNLIKIQLKNLFTDKKLEDFNIEPW